MDIFKFECLQCGQRLSATRDQIGMIEACPSCGEPVQVRPPLPPAAMVPKEPAALPPPLPPPPPSDLGIPTVIFDQWQAQVHSSNQAPRAPSPSKKNRPLPLSLVGICAGIVVLIFAFTNAGFRHRYAGWKDDIPHYEAALAYAPNHPLAQSSRARLRRLQEEQAWPLVNKRDPRSLTIFLRKFPQEKYAAEARETLGKITEEAWLRVRKSQSEKELIHFTETFRDSPQAEQARQALFALYNDLQWVRGKRTVAAYERFLKQNPNSPDTAIVRKELIDLEVAELSTGTASLPKAALISRTPGNGPARMEYENGTNYTLTIRYSGELSGKLVIPTGQSEAIDLPGGDYRIVATVDAARVRPFHGTEAVSNGGRYRARLYIRGETSIPSYQNSIPLDQSAPLFDQVRAPADGGSPAFKLAP